MRRLMLLLCLLAAPSFGAVETTTVNGKVVLSDGAAATAGSITCTLSTPGTALDGATSQRVAGSETATIGSDGTITGLTLVPNDAITPSGTTYRCTFSVSAPRRASWDETWSVTSSPDPVNVGSITRLNVAPGIAVGSFLQYVSAEPSGACTASEAPRYATATDKICECVALAWSCAGQGATPAGADGDVQVKSGPILGTSATRDLDGDGATTGDANADGTADEAGGYTAAMRAGRITSGAVRAWDVTGDGTPDNLPVDLTAIAEARAHALLYGDPDYYLLPAVFDAWNAIFLGRPQYADCDADGTAAGLGAACGLERAQILSCNGACTGSVTNQICVATTDATGDGTNADTDNDGSTDFKVGDVVFFGNSAGTTTDGCFGHRITAIASGGSCAGNDSLWSLNPALAPTPQNATCGVDLDADGSTTDDGRYVIGAWKNTSHYSEGAAYLLGYRLAYASRDEWGAYGHNLLRNAQADYDGTVENWTSVDTDANGTAGALAGLAWSNSPAIGVTVNECRDGSGSNACIYGNNTGGPNSIVSDDVLTVQPWERYVVRWNHRSNNSATRGYVRLYTDPESDGTYAVDATASYQLALNDFYWATNQMGNLFATLTVPEGVHRARLAFTAGGTGATDPTIDDVQLVRSRVYSSGNSDSLVNRTASTYLINDPGSLSIVLPGDSWAKPAGAWGTYLRNGFCAGMQTRLGRDICSQVVATGMGGQTTAGLLSGNTCVTSTWTYGGGTDNCWYAQIGRYRPLYAIVILGTNDASASVPTATYIANMRAIVGRLRAQGTIPIIVGPSPIGGVGSTLMTTAHSYRDALNASLRWVTP